MPTILSVVEGTVPVASALPVGWASDFLFAKGGGQFAFRSASAGTGVPPDLSMPMAMNTMLAEPKGSAGMGARLAAMGAGAAEAGKPAEPTVVFSGVPEFVAGEAILFDSSRDEHADVLPESATVRGLKVKFPDGAPDLKTLDRALSLLVFVGDLASPRAVVRLADIVRRRGERPLNVSRASEETVRIVLTDPAGAWKRGGPRIEVALA